MALVDYRGFRLIAMSLLPVNEGTIVYGSNDGGRTVHDDDKFLRSKMKRAAEILNLKPHECGLPGATRQLLYSAADIEGHRGTDDHYYLLDFARTFPCLKPDRTKIGCHLTRLFRSEFVKSYHTPLCSDAFSRFTDASHNVEIVEATSYLMNTLIPRFCVTLIESNPIVSIHRFTAAIHSQGINVHLIGHLFTEIHSPTSTILTQHLHDSQWKAKYYNDNVPKVLGVILVEMIGSFPFLFLF